MSRSCSHNSTARYILLMSEVRATAYVLNLMRISVILGKRVGPIIRKSFSETPEVILALASKATLNFVVELLTLITACIDM